MFHEEETKDDCTFDHDDYQCVLIDEPKKIDTKGISWYPWPKTCDCSKTIEFPVLKNHRKVTKSTRFRQ